MTPGILKFWIRENLKAKNKRASPNLIHHFKWTRRWWKLWKITRFIY